jgi:hypothetical protein
MTSRPLVEQIYDDILTHHGAGDGIAAIAMNRFMAAYLSSMEPFALSMLSSSPATGPRFQLFGYPVALIDEIPDAEWLVVCKDQAAFGDFATWWSNEIKVTGSFDSRSYFEKVIRRKATL